MGQPVAGQSGIATITKFDHSALAVHFAGEVKGFKAEDYIPAKEARHMDTFIHFGIAAGTQALKDSGTGDRGQRRPHRRAGRSGIGGLPMIEDTHAELTNRGPRRISPFFVPGSIINMISGHLSIIHGVKGPNTAAVTACDRPAQHRHGRTPDSGRRCRCHAGGWRRIHGFAAGYRGLCRGTRAVDPQRGSGCCLAPWDKGRDGFVLGEGAGVMMLEEYESAKARGARIYAELVGFGMSGDAFHMTAPNTDGPRRCMVNALKDAGINADAVQYLNAHGTSTPLGDKNEADAIAGLRRARLQDGGQLDQVDDRPPSGWCGWAGVGLHRAGAAPPVSPPTINLVDRDPECDTDFVANTARDMKIDVAVKNNFGFGGTNGTLVFRRA